MTFTIKELDLTTWSDKDLDILDLEGLVVKRFMQRVADRSKDVLWQFSDDPEARVWRHLIVRQAHERRQNATRVST
jgi:hypothetical protein